MKLTITSVVQGIAQEYAFEGTQEEILSSVFEPCLEERHPESILSGTEIEKFVQKSYAKSVANQYR